MAEKWWLLGLLMAKNWWLIGDKIILLILALFGKYIGLVMGLMRLLMAKNGGL